MTPLAEPPTGSVLAARARRALAARNETLRRSSDTGRGDPADDAGAAGIASALDRFHRPLDLRVRGAAGAGAQVVADLVRADEDLARDWRVTVEDIDDVVGSPGGFPDAEILCLCTAPCHHERLWMRRPRPHPLFVLATSAGRWESGPPDWAHGLPALDAHDPDEHVVTELRAAVHGAARDVPRLREHALAASLAELSARPDLTDLLEPVFVTTPDRT